MNKAITMNRGKNNHKGKDIHKIKIEKERSRTTHISNTTKRHTKVKHDNSARTKGKDQRHYTKGKRQPG